MCRVAQGKRSLLQKEGCRQEGGKAGKNSVVGQLATGVFHPVATGAVSSDGTTITMDADEGIEFLTWVAIVEAP